MPTSALFIMAVSQYVAKIGYEIVCYPLVSAVVNWWKNKEGIDVYDTYQKKAVF